ncbi:hypothetical protein ACN20G_27275 (plasmid) [Streptomyces sp. BI20]|uniref:hypothetical protein n=1 Tax=Streptomyces sp. BI20 TaxID=3403460 RepID=UPI003C776F6D
METEPPPWKITLVCGASGVGKSRLAVPLARRYGLPLTEVDDIVTAVTALTTPAQLPVLHFWDTHPEAAHWPAERIAELHLTMAEALLPAVRAVVEDHLAFDAPVVMEGDFILPELAAEYPGAVRALVVTEDDPDRLTANFAAREPGPEQRPRAETGLLVGAELARRALAAGQAVLPARPWDDGPDRADRALRTN